MNYRFADVSVIVDGFGATYVSFYFSINHVLHILRATSFQLDPSLSVPLRVGTRYKSRDRIKRTSSLAMYNVPGRVALLNRSFWFKRSPTCKKDYLVNTKPWTSDTICAIKLARFQYAFSMLSIRNLCKSQTTENPSILRPVCIANETRLGPGPGAASIQLESHGFRWCHGGIVNSRKRGYARFHFNIRRCPVLCLYVYAFVYVFRFCSNLSLPVFPYFRLYRFLFLFVCLSFLVIASVLVCLSLFIFVHLSV